MSDLDERRRDFEARLEETHAALEAQFGWAPRAKAWVLPVVALAAGVAAALWLRRGNRRRLPRRSLR
jgi:hypothetical protein